MTVLTWNQFVPRLGEFGRTKMPRKWGRMLDRLVEPPGPNMRKNREFPESGRAAEVLRVVHLAGVSGGGPVVRRTDQTQFSGKSSVIAS